MSTRILSTLVCSSAALLFAACENAMFIGEQHGMNLSVEAKSDATEPAKFNFGFESHTAIVVPPKRPLSTRALSGVNNVAEGDLLSSVSRFRIIHTGPDDKMSNKVLAANTLAIQSAVATGAAADAVVGPSAKVAPDSASPLRALRLGAAPTGISFGDAAAAIVKRPTP